MKFKIDPSLFLYLPMSRMFVMCISDWGKFNKIIEHENEVQSTLARRVIKTLEHIHRDVANQLQVHPKDPLAQRLMLIAMERFVEIYIDE